LLPSLVPQGKGGGLAEVLGGPLSSFERGQSSILRTSLSPKTLVENLAHVGDLQEDTIIAQDLPKHVPIYGIEGFFKVYENHV